MQNKPLTLMMMRVVFDVAAGMLRHPEEFPPDIREETAKVLDKYGQSAQDGLTTALMSEAVRDVPDAKL